MSVIFEELKASLQAEVQNVRDEFSYKSGSNARKLLVSLFALLEKQNEVLVQILSERMAVKKKVEDITFASGSMTFDAEVETEYSISGESGGIVNFPTSEIEGEQVVISDLDVTGGKEFTLMYGSGFRAILSTGVVDVPAADGLILDANQRLEFTWKKNKWEFRI